MVFSYLRGHSLLGVTLDCYLLIFLFLTLNIAFNSYNRYLFSPPEKGGVGFQIPLIATVTHALAGFVTALFLALFPSLYVPSFPSTPRMWANVLGISLFFGAGIGLNNASLQFLPLSLQQVIRSMSPVAVAVAAMLLEDRVVSIKQGLSLCVLVGGVMMAVFGDTAGTHAVGVILCFASVIAGALQYTFVSITTNPKSRLSTLDVLLFTSLPIVVLMLPACFLNNEFDKFAKYANEHSYGVAIGWVLLGQVLAVSYNLTVFMFIKTMSALYISVCGIFKVVLIVLFSIVVMGERVGAIPAIGLTLALVGFVLNSYYEFTEKANKPAATPTATAAPADGAVTDAEDPNAETASLIPKK